jgi:hypothetical protein
LPKVDTSAPIAGFATISTAEATQTRMLTALLARFSLNLAPPHPPCTDPTLDRREG